MAKIAGGQNYNKMFKKFENLVLCSVDRILNQISQYNKKKSKKLWDVTTHTTHTHHRHRVTQTDTHNF